MLRRMILLTGFAMLWASPVWGQDNYPRAEVFAGLRERGPNLRS
jgi:hypothetical protein